MIDLVYDHGKYYLGKDSSKTLEELTVELWEQQCSKSDKEKSLLIIDLKKNCIGDIKLVEYDPFHIIKSGVFRDKGNASIGSGFCVPKNIKKLTEEKYKKELKRIFEYCGISFNESIKNKIIKRTLSYKKELNNIFCILFTYDGKYLIEKIKEIDNNIYNKKVLKVYRTDSFSKKRIRIKKNFCCQFCGCKDQDILYDKIGWSFCTNDCKIFGHNDKVGTCIICYKCLTSLMYGKVKIMKNHKINWQGENVIIIPHNIN